jgi:hypothetical protein
MPIEQLQILPKALFEGKRVAVVGNGGISDEDDRLIAACDLVVRFNNYATREKIRHTADRFRCDVLFTTFDLHSPGAQPPHVVIGIPFPFHAREIIARAQQWYPNAGLYTVNPYTNLQMCDEVGCGTNGTVHPFPSVGFTALWHLHRMGIKNLHLFGFNWYSDLQKLRVNGHDLRSRDYPKNWNHNYPKELEWILRNLNVKSSPAVMRVLEMGRKQLGL